MNPSDEKGYAIPRDLGTREVRRFTISLSEPLSELRKVVHQWGRRRVDRLRPEQAAALVERIRKTAWPFVELFGELEKWADLLETTFNLPSVTYPGVPKREREEGEAKG